MGFRGVTRSSRAPAEVLYGWARGGSGRVNGVNGMVKLLVEVGVCESDGAAEELVSVGIESLERS